jgi:hypothetical protein
MLRKIRHRNKKYKRTVRQKIRVENKFKEFYGVELSNSSPNP